MRGAQWAVSDRQAALILVLPVQQRLIRSSDLLGLAVGPGLYRRRGLIRSVVGDIADGAQALSELDFGAACRRYGLPTPDRQIVRRGPRGRVYLDAGWRSLGLAIEVDGIHHELGLAVVDDALRQNAVVLGSEIILRIPVLGLRTQEAAFMGQVVAAYQGRGGRLAA